MLRSLFLISSLGLMAKAGATEAAPEADAGGAGGEDSSTSQQKPEVKTKAKKVKVKVLVGAVGEDDKTYLKGETFDTTEDRAAALGDSVEIVK